MIIRVILGLVAAYIFIMGLMFVMGYIKGEENGTGLIVGSISIISAAVMEIFLFRKYIKIKPFNINLKYLLITLVLLVPLSYFGYRQHTVSSCQELARTAASEVGYGLDGKRFTKQALALEVVYNSCMRDKGFSG